MCVTVKIFYFSDLRRFSSSNHDKNSHESQSLRELKLKHYHRKNKLKESNGLSS